MKNFSFPTAHTVLLIIAGLVALLTWVVPSGNYEELKYDKSKKVFIHKSQNGEKELPATQETLDKFGLKISLEKFTSGGIWKPVGIPNTYHTIESNPQGVMAFIQSPIKGIGGDGASNHGAIDVILFVLIIGGFIGIINYTGAFDAGVLALARQMRGRETILIVIITCLIALGGTTFGLAEETIAFYPILVPVFLAAGYDALVALGAIYIGSAIGTMVSTVNPFSAIIASDAAGINWVDGLPSRLFFLILGTVICLWYIIRYAERVRKDPSQSIIYDVICLWYIIRYAERVRKDPSQSIIYEQKEEIENMFLSQEQKEIAFTGRIQVILALFFLSFVVMIWGVSSQGWWFLEMTTLFFVASILIGVVAFIKNKFLAGFLLIGGLILVVASLSNNPTHQSITSMLGLFGIVAIGSLFLSGNSEKEFVREFVKGANDLLGVALIIGIARGVTVLMDDGAISDTLLYGASSVVDGMPKWLFANVMLFLYAGLSFFIPSSSGMAVLSMPIMAPLADVVGVPREIVVDAYQYGMGLLAFINPTGLILASLVMVNVTYDKWLKFVMPLLGILTLVTMLFLTIKVYL